MSILNSKNHLLQHRAKSLAIPYGTRCGLKVDAAKWSLPDDVPASASPQAILAH